MEKKVKVPLFRKDFTLVVIGQIISLFGNAILCFALPLYLLRQTGSAALFGMVSAFSILPTIVLSLLGGVLADRVNKKDIMVILDFSTAVLIALFGIGLGEIPLVPLFIFMLMILYGIQGIYKPAVQASIPRLVTVDQLLPANAVINQVNTLSGLLGPVIGGILFGVWGLSPILIVSCVCFVCSAIMELFIRIPHTKQKVKAKGLSIVKRDMQDSIRFIKDEKPVLMRIMWCAMQFNGIFASMLLIGLPVLMTRDLGVSDQLFGYSQAALAAGGICGGILAGMLAKKLVIHKTSGLLLAGVACCAPMILVLVFPVPVMLAYVVIFVMSFLMMIVITIFSIQLVAFVQKQTPTELAGKVFSCVMAASMCAQPLGQAMYGVLFQIFDKSSWIVILGAAVVTCGVAEYTKKAMKGLA